MKTQTNLLISAVFMFIISSCEQVDIETINKNEMNRQAEVSLISVKDVTDEYNNLLRSTKSSEWDYPTFYEDIIPIYRYQYYHSPVVDHFYDTSQANTVYHDGRTYNYEANEFHLISGYSSYGAAQLNRFYSSSLIDHMLSNASSITGYSKETTLGGIFQEQKIGTVPLKEYYSSERNKHLYVWRNTEIEDWIPVHDPDFNYVKTIGYVYPARVDDKKQATRFIFKAAYPNQPDQRFEKINLKIRAYEGDNIYEIEYSAKTDSQGGATFTMPNTYTVIAANADIDRHDSSSPGFVKDLTGTPFHENEIWGGVEGASAIILFFDREVNGYDVTFTYREDIIVGTEYSEEQIELIKKKIFK